MTDEKLHLASHVARSWRKELGRKYSGPNAWMAKCVGNVNNGNRGHQPKKARNRKAR